MKEGGITRVSRGVGLGVEIWFDERLVKVVGNETKTLLCSYESLEGVCFVISLDNYLTYLKISQ